MEVTWTPPENTGYGVADSSAPIVNYTIYTSLCGVLDLTEKASTVCQVNQRSIEVRATDVCTTSAGTTSCLYQIQEAGSPGLTQDQVYYIKVTAQNEFGYSFFSYATTERQTWKKNPKLITPLASSWPIRIAEWENVGGVWGPKTNQFTKLTDFSMDITVLDFPFVATGATLQVEFDTNPVKYGTVEIWKHTLNNPLAYLEDELGIGVLTSMRFKPPKFGTMQGIATGRVFLTKYPKKFIVLSHGTCGKRSAAWPLPACDSATGTVKSFVYPSPTVSQIIPAAGRLGGGKEIKVRIAERTGDGTRAGGSPNLANLANFIASDLKKTDISVFFGSSCTSQTKPSCLGNITSFNYFSKDSSTTTQEMKLKPPSSPTGEEGFFVLRFFVRGIEIPMTVPVEYKFRGTHLSSFTPRSGLTTGGALVTVVVKDLEPLGILLDGIPSVSIGSSACTGVTVNRYDMVGMGSDLELKCTTSSSACNLQSPGCSYQISVTVPRQNLAAKSVLGSDPAETNLQLRNARTFFDTIFAYEIPPDPVFLPGSITILNSAGVAVRGEAFGEDSVWVSKSRRETVEFKVNFMYVSDPTQLSVNAGGGSGTIVSAVPTGSESDVRTASTVITVTTPTNRPASCGSERSAWCLKSIVVTYGGKTATSSTIFEYKDTSKPKMVKMFPSEGGYNGGTIVLAGVTGYPSVSGATFGTAKATLLGAVTLDSWLAKDSAYQQQVGGNVLSSFIPQMGSGISSTLQSVIGQMQNEIQEDADIKASTSWIVFLMSPQSTPLASAKSVSVTVLTGSSGASQTLSIVLTLPALPGLSA